MSGPDAGHTRRAVFLACLAVAAASLCLYARTVGFDLLAYDDPLYVTRNPVVSEGITARGLFWSFTYGTWESNYFVPLTWLTFLVDGEIHGTNPGGYHLSNALLHAANAVLLLLAFFRLTGSLKRSLAVAVLFAVHPLHVEAVAWVASRKHLVYGVFWWAALFSYGRHARNPGPGSMALVVLFFFLSVLGSPAVVTMPLVLLVLDYWPLGRFGHAAGTTGGVRTGFGSLVLEKAPLVGISVVAGAATFFTQRSEGALAPSDAFSLLVRAGNMVLAFFLYVWRTLVPVNLSIAYPMPEVPPWWQAGAAAAVLAGITWAAVHRRRDLPWFLAGWLWFVLALLPMSGLVVVGPHVMADRYTYVSLTGLFLILVWGAVRLARRWTGWKARVAAGAMAACVMLLCFASWDYTGAYADTETVFQRALERDPDNYVAHGNLGLLYNSRGEYDKAVRHLAEAIRRKPDFAKGVEVLACIHTRRGELDDALTVYMQAFSAYGERSPPEIPNNIGNLLLAKGELDMAARFFRAALKRKPDLAEAHIGLGTVLEEKGEYERAVSQFYMALEAEEFAAPVHLHIARAMTSQGRMVEAAYHFRRVLEREPRNHAALNGLGVTSAEAGLLEKAEEYFRKSLAVEPGYEPARANLEKLRDMGNGQ
ncbi:MAG: tetratricopeptide repeat protein [Desulfatibacillaceae bacterium]